MSKCIDCPHTVGDSYQRDCAAPDCYLGGWKIEKNLKPIPSRNDDWDFTHDDYDYCTETGGNGLAGTAKSYDDAVQQIIEIESSR